MILGAKLGQWKKKKKSELTNAGHIFFRQDDSTLTVQRLNGTFYSTRFPIFFCTGCSQVGIVVNRNCVKKAVWENSSDNTVFIFCKSAISLFACHWITHWAQIIVDDKRERYSTRAFYSPESILYPHLCIFPSRALFKTYVSRRPHNVPLRCQSNGGDVSLVQERTSQSPTVPL